MNWKCERSEIALRTLPSGHTLTAPVFTLRGEGQKKCYIQANNHGGEIAGNGAIFALLKKLKSYDIYGTIIIVPHCNPVSLNNQIDHEQHGVYDAATGQNWNRLFKLPADRKGAEWRVNINEFARLRSRDPWKDIKREFRREMGLALDRWRKDASRHGLEYNAHVALALQSLSYDADLVLDLHTGDIAPRYLYAPEYTRASAPYFHIPHVLFMKNDFSGAFDEVNFSPWMTLVEELTVLGRNDIALDVEAFTVELGSLERIDPHEMEQDSDRILNYLRHKGVVSGESVRPQHSIYFSTMEHYISYAAPASGLLVIAHPPGTRLKAGDEIGYILTMRNFDVDSPDKATTPIRVLDDCILITRRMSPVVFQGQIIFKVMANYETL